MKMTISPNELDLIKRISDKNSEKYVNLVDWYKSFQYPVSLEFSKKIGKKAYQTGSIDPLEFFHILTNKIYTTIIAKNNASTLAKFILNEKGDEFKGNASKIISAAKEWESGDIDNKQFAIEIESFYNSTKGVALRVTSFFLRMLLPAKLSTLDMHVVNALRMFGFERIKNIDKFTAIDYLEYNVLLEKIGLRYRIESESGLRAMTPAEVDMALFMYDKLGSQDEIIVTKVRDEKANQTRNKIEKIMKIIEAVYKNAISVAEMDWARKAKDEYGKLWSAKIRGSAEKMKREMDKHARKGNLKEIYNYYINALGSERGMRIGELLKQYGKKSLESEFEKVKKIYDDP